MKLLAATILVAGLTCFAERCGFESPPPEVMLKMKTELDNHDRIFMDHNDTYTIDTYIHVEVMNDAYAPAGFKFVLKSVDLLIDNALYTVEKWSKGEEGFQKALHKGTYGDLNLYLINALEGASGEIDGHCSLPNGLDLIYTETILDGCVFVVGSLPGGKDTNYNHGMTAVHETGHWLGLLHTFQGGCDGPGDGVNDTPAQFVPTKGCPKTNPNTCPDRPGLDPIHNYMNYASDQCMTEFTPGQIKRMRSAYDLYRRGR
ncbi:Extracellular metalloprotease [Pseudocercospora fuligena]|uniref:Extracellular metalloprotease n=1 Tax=Pseudocercospora fuligena TaxID=685502 RepID=A0A8H6RLY3_9PEZI|nr:Extracellular metalloprotease [Pseudocercospora fuligena]